MFNEAFEGLAISVEGRIVLANRALARLGRCEPEELVGKTVLELATADCVPNILKRIRENDQRPYEVVAIRPDGSTFPCEVMGHAIMYRGSIARLTSFRDLTQQKAEERARRRVEERLQSAQKLESLAMIAGGVAHDFNNLLLVMLGHAELARTHADGRTAMHLAKIEAAASAASQLTSQMLTFAGRGAADCEQLQLGELIYEVVAMFADSTKGDLIDTSGVEAGLPAIWADRVQVRQLLVNLLLNAMDALAERAGKIYVRLREVERSAEELRELSVDASEGPGRFLELSVDDEGCGMAPETLRRMFDPFFSTKFQGRGLGLATVLGIVQAHAGAVGAESTPGEGTRVALLFPLARA